MSLPSPSQRAISFAPVASVSSPRATPRRPRPNYHLLHHGTPARAPRTPGTARRATTATAPGPSSPPRESDSSDDENPSDPESPSAQHQIRTLHKITTRKAKPQNVRKPREENSWTRHFFDITLLDDTYKKSNNKGSPLFQNRQWACKYCHYTTTDKKSGGNTSKVNNHLKIGKLL
jgi:hypothetical protein